MRDSTPLQNKILKKTQQQQQTTKYHLTNSLLWILC